MEVVTSCTSTYRMKNIRLIRGKFARAALFLTVFVASLLGARPALADLNTSHASVKAVMAVQKAVTGPLMSLSEILGTAVGGDAAGDPVLVVYVDQDARGASDVVRAMPPHIR